MLLTASKTPTTPKSKSGVAESEGIVVKTERYGYLLLLAQIVKAHGTTEVRTTLGLVNDEWEWLSQFQHSPSPDLPAIVLDLRERDYVPGDLLLYAPYTSSVFSFVYQTSTITLGKIRLDSLPSEISLPGQFKDQITEQKILGDIPPLEVGELSATSVVMRLARACREKDHATVEKMLLEPNFLVDDSVYQYILPSTYYPELAMNASAFILCSAIIGRSLGVLKVLMLESKPGSFLDPAAMNNLALQWAILENNPEIITTIADHPRVSSAIYKTPNRKCHLYEIFDTGRDLPLAESAVAVMNTPEFRAILEMTEDQIRSALGDDAKLVRDSGLHLSLLLGYRQTRNLNFAQELCLASSYKERQTKPFW